MEFVEDLDLLAGPRSAAWWSWIVLIACASMFAWAAMHFIRVTAQLEQSQFVVSKLEQKMRFRAQGNDLDIPWEDRTSRSNEATSAKMRIQAATVREALNVADALTHPWGAILEALEYSPDANQDTALLGVHHATTQKEVAIDALAKTDAAAFDLIEALSKRVEVFSQVTLRSRETLGKPQGPFTLHVQLLAQLADLPEPGDAHPTKKLSNGSGLSGERFE